MLVLHPPPILLETAAACVLTPASRCLLARLAFLSVEIGLGELPGIYLAPDIILSILGRGGTVPAVRSPGCLYGATG